MPKSRRIIVLCLAAIFGSSLPVRADDSPQTSSNAAQGASSAWKDPQSPPTPSADSSDRSRERRSALEERVRYL